MLLYSPSIAPTVVRSPFAPTIVQSPASVVPLLVRSPFASTMVQSPASIAPWPARSPFVASVSQSPRRSEHVGTPSFELRSRMDASGSPSKRTLDDGSVQSPSLVRPRRMASAPRYMEPLSHLPEHASPSEAQSVGPLSTLPVEVLNLQREAAPDSRVSMSMTVQQYQRLMQALATELSAARSLGRDEGTSAMEVVVHRLSDHMGRMYQEGQGLRNRCKQMEATMKAELDKAAAWYEQQLKEVRRREMFGCRTTKQIWTEDLKRKKQS